MFAQGTPRRTQLEQLGLTANRTVVFFYWRLGSVRPGKRRLWKKKIKNKIKKKKNKKATMMGRSDGKRE